MNNINFIESVPYLFMAIWLVFSIYYINKAKRRPKRINRYIFESIPQIFATIGILGTFIGIAYGLHSFNVSKIEESIPTLIDGLKTAFYASIIGIIALIISSKFIAVVQKGYEKDEQSDETIALNKLIELITELKSDIKNNAKELNENFIYTEGNNKIAPANFLRDIYSESEQQTKALKSFSTDLANTITAGFETLEKQQDKLDTKPYLENLQLEISALGNKLKDPTTEMTQNVVKDLEAALERMVNEFKISVSGSAKAELESLANLLGQAGSSLTDFPVKLQQMTDNLNNNFKGLQEVVQQIAQQTLSQSNESTSAMKKQVEEMSDILKNKVGDLQKNQEGLISQQTENLQSSKKLLMDFNSSIEKMDAFSKEVMKTMFGFSDAQAQLNTAAIQLKSISENVNSSSINFKDAQQNFSAQTNLFLTTNSKTIEEIQKSLIIAKNVSEDYAQKFNIIENGLKEIFGQIQIGLNDYRDTVGESLQSYLGKYSEALTTTVESLRSAIQIHENTLEELTEQLDKHDIKAKKN